AVADKNDDGLAQDLVDALQQHSDFSRIHPYDDRNCLEIILNCIDRNAVKHRMACEGDYKEMVTGFNEITEIISKGTINRKSKCKCLDDFQDESMKQFLTTVRGIIGQILALVNKCRSGDSRIVAIPFDQMHHIDRMKQKIVDLSNTIAREHGITISLRMM